MFHRTTNFSFTAQAIKYTAQFNSNLVGYQKQISSGLRLHRSSDDPIAFRQVSSLNARLHELNAGEYTILDSEVKLNTSVSQLVDANNLLVRAKTLAQQGIQTFTPAERNALATEAEALLASLKEISKSKIGDLFLYSGTRSDVAPFEFGDPTIVGRTMETVYVGADEGSQAFVGQGLSIETLYPGDEVFGEIERRATELIGTTGAAVGQGTDNMIGRATLSVTHTSTTYLGASGVAPGASSVAGDTVIGQVGLHQLEIIDTSGTGAAGTVALNGGEPVPFTNADTDLQVIGSDGNIVFVDTTSITAGFSGTIDLQASGDLSIDNGLSTLAIDFSTNQTVVDSSTGRMTNIDSSGISRTGSDFLEYPNTSNAFQVLYELTLDLRNDRGLDNVEYAAALDRRIGDLTRMSDHMLDVIGQQSASLSSLDQLSVRIQDLQLEFETQLSELQATDIPETVLRMQNDQALLEYTYAITANVTSQSIIDFLR